MSDQELVSLRVLLSELGITDVNEVVTDVVDSRRLVISKASQPSCPLLELEFPCTVIDGTCRAKYKSKTGTLTVCAQPANPIALASSSPAGEPCGSLQAQEQQQEQDEATASSAAAKTSSSAQQRSADPVPDIGGQDDAPLLKEFADEAYLVSLGLDHPARGRSGDTSQAHSPSCRPAQPPTDSSTESQHASTAAKSCNTPELPAATHSTPHASQALTAPADEDVQLGAGIDCSHLASVFGCSFGLGFGAKKSSSKHDKKAERKRAAATLKAVAAHLYAKGWAACDNYIPEDVVKAVRTEIVPMRDHYIPGEIWVGKESSAGAQVTVSDVRGDSVLWMDEQALSATAFIKDGKRHACNFYTLSQVVKAVDRLITQELPAHVPELEGLAAGGRSDAMLAIYPESSRFQKHIDNTTSDGRRLTCLLYLNPCWQPENGGALRLFAPGHAPVDVLPLGGRVAFFWSKTVAHEVRRTFKPRHSFTLWYYDAMEKAEALASARVGGQGSAAAQAQAKALLRDILAQDAIPGTDEGCQILAARIKAMTTSSLSIVAGIVGAASVQDFVYAASNMTPDRLAMLRDEIGRMGLQSHAPTI